MDRPARPAHFRAAAAGAAWLLLATAASAPAQEAPVGRLTLDFPRGYLPADLSVTPTGAAPVVHPLPDATLGETPGQPEFVRWTAALPLGRYEVTLRPLDPTLKPETKRPELKAGRPQVEEELGRAPRELRSLSLSVAGGPPPLAVEVLLPLRGAGAGPAAHFAFLTAEPARFAPAAGGATSATLTIPRAGPVWLRVGPPGSRRPLVPLPEGAVTARLEAPALLPQTLVLLRLPPGAPPAARQLAVVDGFGRSFPAAFAGDDASLWVPAGPLEVRWDSGLRGWLPVHRAELPDSPDPVAVPLNPAAFGQASLVPAFNFVPEALVVEQPGLPPAAWPRRGREAPGPLPVAAQLAGTVRVRHQGVEAVRPFPEIPALGAWELALTAKEFAEGQVQVRHDGAVPLAVTLQPAGGGPPLQPFLVGPGETAAKEVPRGSYRVSVRDPARPGGSPPLVLPQPVAVRALAEQAGAAEVLIPTAGFDLGALAVVVPEGLLRGPPALTVEGPAGEPLAAGPDGLFVGPAGQWTVRLTEQAEPARRLSAPVEVFGPVSNVVRWTVPAARLGRGTVLLTCFGGGSDPVLTSGSPAALAALADDDPFRRALEDVLQPTVPVRVVELSGPEGLHELEWPAGQRREIRVVGGDEPRYAALFADGAESLRAPFAAFLASAGQAAAPVRDLATTPPPAIAAAEAPPPEGPPEILRFSLGGRDVVLRWVPQAGLWLATALLSEGQADALRAGAAPLALPSPVPARLSRTEAVALVEALNRRGHPHGRFVLPPAAALAAPGEPAAVPPRGELPPLAAPGEAFEGLRGTLWQWVDDPAPAAAGGSFLSAPALLRQPGMPVTRFRDAGTAYPHTGLRVALRPAPGGPTP